MVNKSLDKKYKEKKQKKYWYNYIIVAYFILLALVTIFPFYIVVITSLTDAVTYAQHTPYLLPNTIDLTAFKLLFNDKYFIKSFLVTVFVTVVGTGLNMVVTVLTAYALSRKHFQGRNIILKFIVLTMLFSGGLVPTYLLVSKLGLIDSVWSMILPVLVSSTFVIIMKNSFESLPDSLEEAAKLDGANEFQILTRIYLPISKPFLAAFTLFYAVERWNEWYTAYLYISNRELKPLQIYLKDLLVTYDTNLAPQLQSMLSNKIEIFPQALQMATIIVTVIPILLVYPYIQKHFTTGLLDGSIKE